MRRSLSRFAVDPMVRGGEAQAEKHREDSHQRQARIPAARTRRAGSRQINALLRSPRLLFHADDALSPRVLISHPPRIVAAAHLLHLCDEAVAATRHRHHVAMLVRALSESLTQHGNLLCE